MTILKLGNGQTIEAVDMADLVDRNLETPDFQRDLKPEKVDAIVCYQRRQMQETGSFNFLGELTICTTRTHYYLVDGMHRYAAMRRLLLEESHHTSMVVVRFVDLHVSRTSMEQIFLQINLATPMDGYIITSMCQRHQRRIMDEVRQHLRIRFKPYLTDSMNPRKPNINPNELVGGVCTLEMLQTFHNDSDKIMRFIMAVNTQIESDVEDVEFVTMVKKKINGGVSKPAREKIVPCYIAWIYPEYMQQDRWKEWVTSYLADTPIFRRTYVSGSKTTSSLTKPKKKKKSVPKAIRHNVWRCHFGEEQAVGRCFVCTKKITQMRFECGHVVSDANGGKCTESNLRPVCGECNRSMGKKDMDVYCREHGYEWN